MVMDSAAASALAVADPPRGAAPVAASSVGAAPLVASPVEVASLVASPVGAPPLDAALPVAAPVGAPPLVVAPPVTSRVGAPPPVVAPPVASPVGSPPVVAAPLVQRRRAPWRWAEAVVPAWFASVMGTGIVAVALELLPVALPGAWVVAVALWAVAVGLLVMLGGAVVARRGWRGVLGDAVVAPTLGVPPMAVLTVGAATLLAGRHVLGEEVAVAVALVAWAVGTVAGVVVAVVVPCAMVVRRRRRRRQQQQRQGQGEAPRLEDVCGTWLLAVVPPLVSATTGAGLVAHVPAGEGRLDLLIVLYALFGLGVMATLPLVALLWARLLVHGPGTAERAPALWVALGPLGQSITAANLLGVAAGHATSGSTAAALRAFGLVYGLPVAGFAALWLALAIALTRHHAARDGIPFSALWWSFVFPVGTLVTGTSELALRTGSEALRGVAVALFAGLVAAWAITAARALACAPAGRPLRRPA